MNFTRTVPPTGLPVELREAARNLGIEDEESDVHIERWLRGITRTLELRIGQCLMRQTLRGTLPAFAPAIALPHPVLRVVSIDYIDQAGAEQSLPLSAVRVVVQDEYTTLLKPARGQAWPATLQDDEAVLITVECGYGDSPADTPDDLKLYILAKLVEQYDPGAGGEKETVQTSYLENMLNHYRRY